MSAYGTVCGRCSRALTFHSGGWRDDRDDLCCGVSTGLHEPVRQEPQSEDARRAGYDWWGVCLACGEEPHNEGGSHADDCPQREETHDAPVTRTGAKASETDDLDGTETTP